MFSMEDCFYVLISQAMRCLKDPTVLPRDKQRVKQELSSELVSLLWGFPSPVFMRGVCGTGYFCLFVCLGGVHSSSISFWRISDRSHRRLPRWQTYFWKYKQIINSLIHRDPDQKNSIYWWCVKCITHCRSNIIYIACALMLKNECPFVCLVRFVSDPFPPSRKFKKKKKKRLLLCLCVGFFFLSFVQCTPLPPHPEMT